MGENKNMDYYKIKGLFLFVDKDGIHANRESGMRSLLIHEGKKDSVFYGQFTSTGEEKKSYEVNEHVIWDLDNRLYGDTKFVNKYKSRNVIDIKNYYDNASQDIIYNEVELYDSSQKPSLDVSQVILLSHFLNSKDFIRTAAVYDKREATLYQKLVKITGEPEENELYIFDGTDISEVKHKVTRANDGYNVAAYTYTTKSKKGANIRDGFLLVEGRDNQQKLVGFLHEYKLLTYQGSSPKATYLGSLKK